VSVTGHITQARTFDSLRRHRNYRLYFGGQMVSVSGTWMQNVAQAWLVLQLTGSPRAVGVLAICQFGPFALFGLAGGVLSDRLDRRRTLLLTQSLSMVFAAALATLTLSHHVSVLTVEIIAVLNGFVLVLDTPARQAFTVEMVGRKELPNAIALNSSIFNGSRIIGPAIAGVVIGSAGVGACFAVNAASYLAVLASLLLMRTHELHRFDRGTVTLRVFQGIGEGLAYAARTPVIRTVLVTMLFVGTISINFNVLLPVLTERTLHQGAGVLGLLSACFGAGALVGALLSASLGRADTRVLIAAGLGLGLSELGVAPLHSVALTALLLTATGISFSLFTSNSNSTLQLIVPDRLRGRVLSLYGYVFFGTAPLGGYLAGWLSERGGTVLAFGVAGAVAALSTAAAGLWFASRAPVPARLPFTAA
jgi:MFS family permease